MTETTCRIEGCEKLRDGRYRMCRSHRHAWEKYGDPLHPPAYKRGDEVARFWSKVDKRGDDECWPWIGTITADGYGQFVRSDRTKARAHRYAYELIVAPIPAGLDIDHVKAWGCTRTDCVNPAHLEPVTSEENWRRGDSPPADNARKVRCIRGHEFDRTYVGANGREWRACTECDRIRQRKRRASLRATL